MTKDEALKLAMEAMEITGGFDVEINAIKEALAQLKPWEKFCDSNCVWTDHHPDCKLAEQKPVAWRHKQFFETQEGWFYADWHSDGINPPSAELLYTTPPHRTWVGLTNEEIQYCVELKNPEAIAEEIEAKLKEKNT